LRRLVLLAVRLEFNVVDHFPLVMLQLLQMFPLMLVME
jgi:hypothetical protein